MENDFQTEVKGKPLRQTKILTNILILQFDYLLTNIVNMKNFVLDWLELGENIGHLVVEGGDEF